MKELKSFILEKSNEFNDPTTRIDLEYMIYKSAKEGDLSDFKRWDKM